ncbi:uncharacterized protein KGF55_001426 [Candida pseudojiufengensis]|uniref:uncharacterized protein n=1 Tax=Candida pseudojiufengensis TaxID=497109 RepID=UPI0022256A84|nr:uncharacterized protein KGF55_001426 [Candida pseudojiufengensis]KAI5965206.1 hypothetical protein KGF55_001426 [Candida pseudojiufengensis]
MFLLNHSKSLVNKVIPNGNENSNRPPTLIQLPSTYLPNPLSPKEISRRGTISSPKSKNNNKNVDTYFENETKSSSNPEGDKITNDSEHHIQPTLRKKGSSVKRKRSHRKKSEQNDSQSEQPTFNGVPNSSPVKSESDHSGRSDPYVLNIFDKGHTLNALEWMLILVILFLLYKLYNTG